MPGGKNAAIDGDGDGDGDAHVQSVNHKAGVEIWSKALFQDKM